MATAGGGGGGGGRRDTCYREVVPFGVMASLQCINVGLNTLFKVASNGGMSRHVFLVYAYAVAAVILLPAPFISSRSRSLPSLNSSILIKIFVLGIFGYLAQITVFTGIEYSSPTLASAIGNLSPAFTFLLAVIFRMEKLSLSSKNTWAKLIGTVVSISGAFVVTFYKGPLIIDASPSPSSLHKIFDSTRSDWILGSLFLTMGYIFSVTWCIYLTHIMKEYPSGFTIIFFYTSSVTVLAAVVGFFVERDTAKWMIGPNIALVCVVCSGVLNGCMSNYAESWVLHLRGPVYVAMFKPLSIAIAAALGVIFLGDSLYLGSVIGATVIVIGFYTVIWGKAKEESGEVVTETIDLESSASPDHPLLQTYNKIQDL